MRKWTNMHDLTSIAIYVYIALYSRDCRSSFLLSSLGSSCLLSFLRCSWFLLSLLCRSCFHRGLLSGCLALAQLTVLYILHSKDSQHSACVIKLIIVMVHGYKKQCMRMHVAIHAYINGWYVSWYMAIRSIHHGMQRWNGLELKR